MTRGRLEADGTITLYARALFSRTEARETLVEELGHLAARDPKLQDLVARLKATLTPEEIQAMRDLSYSESVVAEEALMRRLASEDLNAQQRTLWAQLKAWLTDFYRRLTGKHALDSDLRELLRAALRAHPQTGATRHSAGSQRIKPVSTALKIEGNSQHQDLTGRVLAAIDRVHGDGALPEVPLRASPYDSNAGYTLINPSGEVTEIRIRTDGPWPALTTLHEIGHLLDFKAVGPPGQYCSEMAEGPLIRVMQAIQASRAYGELRQVAESTDHPALKARIEDYLLTKRELWARAYAQFVATRSHDLEMMEQLALARDRRPGRQWIDDDFIPIATAIEAAFKTLEWL